MGFPVLHDRCAVAVAIHRSGIMANLDGLSGGLWNSGRFVALAGVAALTMLLRRRTGMGVGKALMFVALAAFAGLVWLVLALLVYALVMGA